MPYVTGQGGYLYYTKIGALNGWSKSLNLLVQTSQIIGDLAQVLLVSLHPLTCRKFLGEDESPCSADKGEELSGAELQEQCYLPWSLIPGVVNFRRRARAGQLAAFQQVLASWGSV